MSNKLIRSDCSDNVTMTVQCPYKISKYHCVYGKECVENMEKHNGMPSVFFECPVAQRQLNGNPWINERRVEYDKQTHNFKPKKETTSK